jgi:hypothetical protein
MPRRMFTIAAALACAASMFIAVAGAWGNNRPIHLRVLTSTGKTLADFRQFPHRVKVRASHKADCFGSTPPSSDKRYKLKGQTALGVLGDAELHARSLQPLLLTDAAFDSFGLGVCGIGGFSGPPLSASYWYFSINKVAGSVGSNVAPAHGGDSVLWYLTSGNESLGFPSELVLSAPARVKPGVPFSVKVSVFAPDGSSSPAAGRNVSHGAAPTDAAGMTMVTLSSDGIRRLRARGGVDDIPSARVPVCVNERLSRCPARRPARPAFS